MPAISHTPKPWKYGLRKGGSIWLSLGNPGLAAHYQGDLVATEADAKLVAAAPDLLEALEDLITELGDDWNLLHNPLDRAHDAIAKPTQ